MNAQARWAFHVEHSQRWLRLESLQASIRSVCACVCVGGCGCVCLLQSHWSIGIIGLYICLTRISFIRHSCNSDPESINRWDLHVLHVQMSWAGSPTVILKGSIWNLEYSHQIKGDLSMSLSWNKTARDMWPEWKCASACPYIIFSSRVNDKGRDGWQFLSNAQLDVTDNYSTIVFFLESDPQFRVAFTMMSAAGTRKRTLDRIKYP